jgi:hypothetical protein
VAVSQDAADAGAQATDKGAADVAAAGKGAGDADAAPWYSSFGRGASWPRRESNHRRRSLPERPAPQPEGKSSGSNGGGARVEAAAAAGGGGEVAPESRGTRSIRKLLGLVSGGPGRAV